MAKSKLLAALDAHQGLHYKAEKQKRFARQAGKKKRANAQRINLGRENVQAPPSPTTFIPKVESDARESDENQAAVCRTFATLSIHLILMKHRLIPQR